MPQPLALKSHLSSGPGERVPWLRAFTTQAQPPKSSPQNPSKSGRRERTPRSCPLAAIPPTPTPCQATYVHIHGIPTTIDFLKSCSQSCSDSGSPSQRLQDTLQVIFSQKIRKIFVTTSPDWCQFHIRMKGQARFHQTKKPIFQLTWLPGWPVNHEWVTRL